MPTRRRSSTAPPALTDADIADLRAKVGAGEKPRVVVRAASAAVPAGTRGNVIRLGDPREGEFVVVRLGRDEVPFAPGELGLPVRAGKATVTAPTRTPARRQAAATKSTTRATKTPAPAARKATDRTRATSSRGSSAAKRASRRKVQPLTVTLRFHDGAWTVEAQRGARRLSRPSPLRPGAVKAFADHVDQPDVREALTETVESCRAVVAERADKLREELAAAEASLKEYEARRR